MVEDAGWVVRRLRGAGNPIVSSVVSSFPDRKLDFEKGTLALDPETAMPF